MNRRQFVSLFGGAAFAWPLVARAQQGERTRRIVIMPPGGETDSETQARLVAFRQGLDQLGWKEGRNVQYELRWTVGDPELTKRHAAEVVASSPDLIVCGTTPGVQALKRETKTIPILFANVADPVGSGLVPSLAKPGGNVTGFTAVEYAIVGKWLELLKELAPSTKRVLLIGGPTPSLQKAFSSISKASHRHSRLRRSRATSVTLPKSSALLRSFRVSRTAEFWPCQSSSPRSIAR